MILAALAASLSLSQIPSDKQVGERQPVEKQLAEKQAAFVAQTANPGLQQDLALLLRLEAPFPKPASFQATAAGEVVKAIRNAAKLQIEIDGRAFGESSNWESKPVTCEPATMRQALDAVLRAVEPGYTEYRVDVAAGIVVLTDEEGQSRLRAPAQYPLAVVLARMGASEADAPALDLAKAELEEFFALTNPDAWESRGGSIARIVWTGAVATIDAPPSFHHDIRRRMLALEAALPGVNLLWVVHVSDCTGAGAADVVAAVAQPEALERLAKDGLAKRLSAPRLLAKSSEPAEIRIESQKDGGTDALVVRIEPAPGAGGRAFTVRIESGVEGARTAVSMRAVPGVRAAVAFEAGGRTLVADVIGLSELAQKLLKP
jgi:hypothetical protein